MGDDVDGHQVAAVTDSQGKPSMTDKLGTT